MPPIGRLITDVEHGPVLETDGYRDVGVRHYRVDTHDEYEAIRAIGVPKIEDAWSLTATRLLCRYLSTEYIGGTNDSVSGVGGWHRVRAEYSNDALAVPLPQVGTAYTRILSRTFSVPVLRDIRPDPQYNSHLIENGRGAQREVGGTIARVVTWPASTSSSAILSAIDMQARQVVNSNTITLPRLMRTNLQLTLGPRQARYVDYETDYVAGLLQLTHVLVLSPSAASHFWHTLGTRGEILQQVESRIYEEASFAGLW